ncbi:hypothetical protein [Pedobacter antarcticus]|uniref:hypothetical protein n=1 Tax=Pedobacter antarcticus TaxID=34086 RepID=UPI00292FFC39|nr:hypothetical protein [Pedobacter antarcticus]
MRLILTVFFLLFIFNSCFAGKLESDAAIPISQKHITPKLISKFRTSSTPEDKHLFRLNTTENRTFNRIQFSQFSPASIRLFDAAAIKYFREPNIRLYIADPAINYKFIFHLLYPKHVFW